MQAIAILKTKTQCQQAANTHELTLR
jgi:hypothetical protein